MKTTLHNSIHGWCGLRFVPFVFISLALLSLHASAKPIELNDQHLSAITAGNLEDGQPLITNHQTGAVQGPTSSIVAGGAISNIKSSKQVRISGGSQSALRVANLVNAAGADSINGLNIASRTTGRSDGAEQGTVEQSNVITQTYATKGKLAYFAALDASTERSILHNGSETRNREVSIRKEANDVKHAFTQTSNTIDAVVKSKSIFEKGIGINDNSAAIPGFSITIPTFSFDGIKIAEKLKDEFFPKDGAKSTSVSGKTIGFSGSELQLGGIKLKGNDIVIGTSSLTIPTFSLGNINTGERDVCRNFICKLLNSNPEFSVGNVTLNHDQLSFPGWTFEGANPIPGISGLGGGFALIGTGEITAGSGEARVKASIPLDLGEFSGQLLDFVIPWGNIKDAAGKLLDGGKDDHKILSLATQKLPEITLELDLTLPLEFPDGFSGTFDGAVCISNEECGEMRMSKTEYAHNDNSSITYDIADEEYSKSYETIETHRQTSTVDVVNAEANFLALSTASAIQETYSVVVVSGGAQSDVRAINAVNGSNTIIGNGLNLLASQAGTQVSSGMANPRHMQSNTFVQIGGL